MAEGYTFKPQDLEQAHNGFNKASQQVASLQLRLTNRKGQMDSAEGWSDEANTEFQTPYTKNTQRLEKASARLTEIGALIEKSLADYANQIEEAKRLMQQQR